MKDTDITCLKRPLEALTDFKRKDFILNISIK